LDALEILTHARTCKGKISASRSFLILGLEKLMFNRTN
jgi:hypothetical protein